MKVNSIVYMKSEQDNKLVNLESQHEYEQHSTITGRLLMKRLQGTFLSRKLKHCQQP